MKAQPTEFEPVPMDSEDDLFIVYTSGTTNNPRRIVHSQAGYLLYAAFTRKVYMYPFNEWWAPFLYSSKLPITTWTLLHVQISWAGRTNIMCVINITLQWCRQLVEGGGGG